MAGVCHCTVRTITATGGFALFLIHNELNYNSRNDSRQYKAYNDCSYVFPDPFKHKIRLLSNIFA